MPVKILTAVVFKPAVIHSKSKHFGGHLGTWKLRPNSKCPRGQMALAEAGQKCTICSQFLSRIKILICILLTFPWIKMCLYRYVIIPGVPAVIVSITVGVAHEKYGDNK